MILLKICILLFTPLRLTDDSTLGMVLDSGSRFFRDSYAIIGWITGRLSDSSLQGSSEVSLRSQHPTQCEPLRSEDRGASVSSYLVIFSLADERVVGQRGSRLFRAGSVHAWRGDREVALRSRIWTNPDPCASRLSFRRTLLINHPFRSVESADAFVQPCLSSAERANSPPGLPPSPPPPPPPCRSLQSSSVRCAARCSRMAGRVEGREGGREGGGREGGRVAALSKWQSPLSRRRASVN